MALTIYGRKNSSNVQKVLWVCAELGLEFDRIDKGREFGGLEGEEFRSINPNRLVPALVDGEFRIWESNAIIRYLARREGRHDLMPAEPEMAGIVDQWHDWQLSLLGPAFTPLFHELVRKPENLRDPKIIEAGIIDIHATLTVLDEQLASHNFVAGDVFTLADVPLGIYAYRWLTFDVERPRLPHLEAWYAGLNERPAFRQHVMVGLA